MFSIKIPGQNSWSLGVPGADREATGTIVNSHKLYGGEFPATIYLISVSKPQLFNFLENLLSEQKSNFVNKYQKENFFLFNYQKRSICLSSLRSIPKLFKKNIFISSNFFKRRKCVSIS